MDSFGPLSMLLCLLVLSGAIPAVHVSLFIALETRYAYDRCTNGIVASNMFRGRHYRFDDVNQKQNFSLHYKSASLKRSTTY